MTSRRFRTGSVLADWRRRFRDADDEQAVGRATKEMLALLVAGRLDPAAGLELLVDLLQHPRQAPAVAAGLDLELVLELGRGLARGTRDDPTAAALRQGAWHWLDLLRRPALLRRIEPEQRERWMRSILEVVEASGFTLARMLQQRAACLGARTWLQDPARGARGRVSWIEAAGRVDHLARGLLALRRDLPDGPVAIFADNCMEMALVDLACLTTGVVDVMIPSHTTGEDLAYLLETFAITTVFVSTPDQLQRVRGAASSLPKGGRIVTFFDVDATPRSAVLSLAELSARAGEVGSERLEQCREAMELSALATIMVTSGTTGRPKGIRFSQLNLVSKRFARALALPEIGDHDSFLCYLPLFHTFGRFLELLGTLFWGAGYTFLRDPSRESLLEAFSATNPSVFISIPKKWLQLHEEISRRVDLEKATDGEILAATRAVVGSRLRWGLSAAGYLPPEVFRFFQRQGIELMSGFGMTEATGGITMTPPGGYRDESLGLPLPGIELRLDDDGELLMRGPYVMQGYVETDETDSGVDPDGWVRTGDLMERDADGFYRIIDRKKEIYKNIKGETIAPQKIENLFRDFDAVSRVFLVGDHREFNTVLIVPNEKVEDIDLPAMSEAERLAYFRSLVVSVNRFLAPFERIVDFALLDRDFSADRGELTAKGTFCRKVIAAHFAEVIEGLYRRATFRTQADGPVVDFPNWLYQVLGLTASDIRVEDGALVCIPTGQRLPVQVVAEAPGRLRVGSCIYRFSGRHLDLGAMVSAPALWLGNEQLVAFARVDAAGEIRRRRPPRQIEVFARAEPYHVSREEERRIRHALEEDDLSLAMVDLAARMLGSEDERHAIQGIRLLEKILSRGEGALFGEALTILRTAARSSSAIIRRRAFLALFATEQPSRAVETIDSFLEHEGLLDDATIARLAACTTSKEMLEALVEACRRLMEAPRGDRRTSTRRLVPMLNLLAEYGAAHPGSYKRLRAALARMRAFCPRAEDREMARLAEERMQEGFRRWLGPPTRIAVDPETGGEYRWEDVITFEEEMNASDRSRLLGLICGTNFVREAVFLFTGQIIRLSDIPLGGMWVSLLGEKYGKAVYRLTIHTRVQGAYDVAINVNRTLPADKIAEEILWLLVTGERAGGHRLVEDFGGYWRQYDSWSEEFISGETMNRFIGRLGRQRTEDAEERLRAIWPFLVWSGAEAYFDFWNRTRRRFVVADPADYNVIVPTHDFQVGPRIVSVASRVAFTSLGDYLEILWRRIVEPTEKSYPALAAVARRELLLSALLEVTGVRDGLALLEETRDLPQRWKQVVEAFTGHVARRGFLPKRLYFAIARYHRWADLAQGATPQARARMIQDLFDTYNIASLLDRYPEARVRFFRETVFSHAPAALRDALDEVIADLVRAPLEGDEWSIGSAPCATRWNKDRKKSTFSRA
ncbi:MAG: AMP-binding protein [Acidobacteriota bacterium]|nr:AMP-binding protein [Acidobacteriota bacterium]